MPLQHTFTNCKYGVSNDPHRWNQERIEMNNMNIQHIHARDKQYGTVFNAEHT